MLLIRLLRTYVRPYRRLLTVLLILQGVQALLNLYLPDLNSSIIDRGVLTGDTSYIWHLGGWMLLVTAVQASFAVAAIYFGSKLAMVVGRDLRRELFHRSMSLSAREVGQLGAPSLITRVTNDVQQVQLLVVMVCTFVLAAPITLVGGVVLALRQDRGLSWLLGVAMPLLAIILGIIIGQMVPRFQLMQVRLDGVNRVLREQITGIRVVRAFVREPQEVRRFQVVNDELTQTSLEAGRLMALMFPVMMLAINTSAVAVVWFGANRISHGQMTLGSLIAFLTYFTLILQAVLIASFVGVMAPRAAVSGGRIQEVLHTVSSVTPPAHPIRELRTPGTLEFRDVSFGYPGAESPVLDGVTFRALPGKTTAVIGSTGSGKTTLVNLACRLVDATSGEVLVGGVDIRQLDPDVLWHRIGLVPQRPYLFAGTVASNLHYGKPDATADEMWEALTVAQADNFVRTMGGLEAPIAQGGTNVSGGQRQRLSIARALVRRPDVYVFDDSFSALDLATDARLRTALVPYTAEATMIVIAQRVSSIISAEQILVLEAGVPVGLGNHEELLETCPTYAEIVASQTGGEDSGVSIDIETPPTDEPGPEPIPEQKVSTAPAPMHRMGAFGMPLERSENSRATLRRLAIRLRPEWFRVIGVVFLTLGGICFSVLGPKLLGDGTDIIVRGVLHHGRSGIDFGGLHRLLLLVIVLYLASSSFQYLGAYTLAGMMQRVMRQLRADVEDKLNRVPLGYVDRTARGELLSRVTNDIDNLAQTLQQTVSQLLTNAFMLIGTIVIMFVISPILASVALVSLPLSSLIIRFITRRSRPRFADQWDETGRLNSLVEESLTGHAIVKTFGREREVEADFLETNERLFRSSFGAQFISGSIQPAMVMIGNLNYVGIAVIGGLRVAEKAMTIGGIQAFIQYSRQFAQPLQQLASMANLFQSGLASAERVFELLDSEEQTPDAPPVVVEVGASRRGRVEFDHVSFSYDPARPLITDLSLVAEPGKTVAIVGPTGAGKTTLVNLIMRFYELDQGRIILDGVNIAEMPRAQLRSNIGMVLQDTWLFGGTIRENIAYGNPEATEEQILTAARATYVDRFVRALPDGYDTMVDDEGGVMSVGEKQLLTIARAFLSNPTILILDEATSSVDTRTEVLIQQAMSALRAERTSFVIAHRVSTIRNADTILVMEAGRIVEHGNHADLLGSGGAYARLYNAQFAGAATDVT